MIYKSVCSKNELGCGVIGSMSALMVGCLFHLVSDD